MGPTASGKSALALDLAERLGAGIVSVDSALVYRGLDIGSAKPSAAERARVSHALVDIRDPWQPYSAAEFASDALAAMHAFRLDGRLPLLVGGTGLYFQALLRGLSAMPGADPAIRADIEADAALRGWPSLHAELARVDPEAAVRIEPGDRQRVLRALEVWRASGRPISQWRASRERTPFPFRVLKLVLAPRHRERLHARIVERFDAMLAAGFLDEVRRLRGDPDVGPELPALRAVGYRQAWRHLEGATDAVGFRAEAIAATRQLAKRQITWLRSVFDARWLDPETEAREVSEAIAAFLA